MPVMGRSNGWGRGRMLYWIAERILHRLLGLLIIVSIKVESARAAISSKEGASSGSLDIHERNVLPK